MIIEQLLDRKSQIQIGGLSFAPKEDIPYPNPKPRRHTLDALRILFSLIIVFIFIVKRVLLGLGLGLGSRLEDDIYPEPNSHEGTRLCPNSVHLDSCSWSS